MKQLILALILLFFHNIVKAQNSKDIFRNTPMENAPSAPSEMPPDENTDLDKVDVQAIVDQINQRRANPQSKPGDVVNQLLQQDIQAKGIPLFEKVDIPWDAYKHVGDGKYVPKYPTYYRGLDNEEIYANKNSSNLMNIFISISFVTVIIIGFYFMLKDSKKVIPLESNELKKIMGKFGKSNK